MRWMKAQEQFFARSYRTAWGLAGFSTGCLAFKLFTITPTFLSHTKQHPSSSSRHRWHATPHTKKMANPSQELTQDAAAANTLSDFLAVRDVPSITHTPADLCVVCGSSVLATV